MRYINHLSDFQVIINIKDKEGNIIAPPSVPWEAVFADENECEFTCSYDGTNYTHCIVDFSDIVCFIDNPGFACGKLRCTFHQRVPSEDYSDGVMDLSQPLQCDIMLSKRESDDSTPITIEASPNWARGPKGEQGIQGIQGEKGTDGFSPIVSLTKQGAISTLSITDAKGEHTTEIADGEKGDDGFSPIVSLNKVDKVTTLTITDANGEHTAEINDGVTPDAYTKAESDAMIAGKQNVLTAGNGIAIADDVISVAEEKFTVWSNPRIDEFVESFTNGGYNNDGSLKSTTGNTRSWVFKIGNYWHNRVYYSEMNAWLCDGLDADKNMLNPIFLGESSGNFDITSEHIGKYVVAMSVSGFSNFLGTDYGRCVLFRDEKTQAELDEDERMLSDMYAGNLTRYAVATSAIADTPTLEWGANASMKKDNDRNQFLDIISRPNIVYECNVVKKLNFVYSHCGRLREITPLWDTALVTTAKGLFQQCRALERADLSHLNLSNVTDTGYMFQCCIALKDVVLPELPSVTNMNAMFDACASLNIIELKGLQLVTSCKNMFESCSSLQSIILPELPLVTDCLFMFRNCTSLKSVELQSLQSVTRCTYMFGLCTSLESIVLPEMPNAKDCSAMFQNCTSLQSIVLPALPSVTNCFNMFHLCNKLEALTLNMPLCESFGCYGCYSLKDVEIIDMHSLKGLSFDNCGKVENVTCVNTLPTCKIEFSSCKLLTLDSVTNIIAHLPDLSGTDSKTITFHSDTKKIITEELIAEATNKNWIIA